MTFKRLYLILRLGLESDGYKKASYLKKIKYFAKQGENCYWQPVKIPPEPELIKMGNNVVVASDVSFITHDVIHYVLKHVAPNEFFRLQLGPIQIGNNVFIGSKSIILPNVKIGSNVIIGGGSIVSCDIPDGRIVAGVPAKEIGSFENLLNKRKLDVVEMRNKIQRYEEEWLVFYKNRSGE
ncbi:acyltransferase [Desulforamulus aeronauticus]|uniref:Acetyltransferase (Isoleucine patch superfamily) n=1 Tax=Desulforamulus aeronauticus DSM 10349 TaxID=1121421 RepID=A0A1M6V3Y5_9FIRM|nr:acyltransferase [Desulforamulus aeronauticus]SHK76207.1 Acetyltransferase (isoleucine patch superfamily) [Desulforamulus aeronauticus DSM 10349]